MSATARPVSEQAHPDRRGLAPQRWRGDALGLPHEGRGSLAATGARLGAFLVDAIASALVAALFIPHDTHRTNTVADHLPGTWSLVPLAVDYLVGLLVAGRTLGMYLFGLRLIRVDHDAAIGPLRAAARTLLLFLLIPALVVDRDGRGLPDRLTDTAVVRA
jgi:uncharacterized RDD family membrane protein YckC